MKLDAVKFGLTLGIVWAGCVLSLGITSMFGFGAGLVKAIGSIYIGYGAGIGGAAIGTVWAFLDMGVGGLIIALIYNKLLDLGKK
ncbi:MAG: hypothetical protein ABID35_00490 [Candidatus Margulisiibacteriota bacterium]